MYSPSETPVNWDRNRLEDEMARTNTTTHAKSAVTTPHNLNEINNQRNDSDQSVTKKIPLTPYSTPRFKSKGLIIDTNTNDKNFIEENVQLKQKNAELEALNQKLQEEMQNNAIKLKNLKCRLFECQAKLKVSEDKNVKNQKKINDLQDNINYFVELNQIFINKYGASNNYEFDPMNILYYEQGLVGRGTFSDVYQIIFENEKNFTEQCYALKICKKNVEEMEPNKWEKYQNEISINLLLNHPYIVKFFGYSRISNQGVRPSLLFEYVENGNLERKIQILDKFSKAKIIMQILLAIFYLHEKCEVIHRDLKPSNILVDRNYNIKIADFSEAILNNCIGNHKCGVGTPRYRAPETNVGIYNNKCDIFSFGVIMYSIITNDLTRNFDSEIDFDSFKNEFPEDVCEYVPSMIYDCLKIEYESRLTVREVYDTMYQCNFLIFNSVLLDKVTIPISEEHGTSIFPPAIDEEEEDDDS